MSTHTPHVVIRASAGTGKTFQLSNRFIELLHAGVAVDRILATTFTRKAATEILDRVVVRLAEAAMDQPSCEELATVLPTAHAGPRFTQARAQHLLRILIQNLHRLQIGTLDSFFAQIAGSMSLELGLPPGWSIVDELYDIRLRDEAIELLLQTVEILSQRLIFHSRF